MPFPPPDETDEQFLERLERIGSDWRFSDEFIGKVVRARYPRRYEFKSEEHEKRSEERTQ